MSYNIFLPKPSSTNKTRVLWRSGGTNFFNFTFFKKFSDSNSFFLLRKILISIEGLQKKKTGPVDGSVVFIFEMQELDQFFLNMISEFSMFLGELWDRKFLDPEHLRLQSMDSIYKLKMVLKVTTFLVLVDSNLY